MAMLFFSPSEEEASGFPASLLEKEATMKETGKALQEQYLTILTENIKNSNLLTPRRAISLLTFSINLRSQSHIGKAIQQLRLRGHDLMEKLSEEKSITHHINYSTLLCRNGYHILALRKLLI